MILVFDVNETLSDLTPMEERFAAFGAPPAAARSWFAGVLRDGFALTLAGRPARFADIAVAGLRGVLPDDAAVDAIMDAFRSLPPHPDVAPGIRALAEAGHRMVTLTNGGPGVADALLQRAGVRDRLEQLLSVEAVGPWKPDPRAYQYALDELGVAPGEAMLVAAHPWDIDGAHRAGLRTAFVDRTGRPYPEPFAAPDLVVPDLVALPGRLAAAGS